MPRARTNRADAASLLASAVLLLFATGCGSLQPSSGPSAEEVEELKRRVVGLQQQAAVSEVEVARLRQEVATPEAELEASGRREEPAPPPEPAAPAASIGLGTGVEETDLEEPPPLQPTVALEERAAAPPRGTHPDGQTLYDEGYTLFHRKRYAEAEARFERYIELYPETELTDNALFWIGECRYARGDFSSALAAFTATIDRYPSGNKVADALLKAGKCLEALGNRDQARSTYEEVGRRFPGSDAATAADGRLAQLPPGGA